MIEESDFTEENFLNKFKEKHKKLPSFLKQSTANCKLPADIVRKRRRFYKSMRYFYDISLSPELPFRIVNWQGHSKELTVQAVASDFHLIKRSLIGLILRVKPNIFKAFEHVNYHSLWEGNCILFGPLQYVNCDCGCAFGFEATCSDVTTEKLDCAVAEIKYSMQD